MAVAGGQVQRRVLARVAAHEVGVRADDHLDHPQPPVQRRKVQRRLQLAVPDGGVRELVQQNGHHLRVSVLSCAVQGGFILIVLSTHKMHVFRNPIPYQNVNPTI